MVDHFLDLPEDQRAALLTLRVQTTYFWPQLVQSAQQEGDSFSCQVREKTYEEIEECLTILSQAGHFGFDLQGDGWDYKPVLTLYIHDITNTFKNIVRSIETDHTTSAEKASDKGTIKKILHVIWNGPKL